MRIKFEVGQRVIYQQAEPDNPVNASWSHRNGKTAEVLDDLDGDEVVHVRFEDESHGVFALRAHLSEVLS